MSKIPLVDYGWIDEYHEPASLEIYRECNGMVIRVEGVGDGTLEMVLTWKNFLSFADQVFDLHNELVEEIEEALDDTEEEG